MLIYNEISNHVKKLGVAVYSCSPTKRTIGQHIKKEIYVGGEKLLMHKNVKYFLSLPQILFGIQYGIEPMSSAPNASLMSANSANSTRVVARHMYMAFSMKEKPLLNDSLYYSAFPNVGDCGKICMKRPVASSVESLAKKIVSEFWQGLFTEELDWGQTAQNYPLNSFEFWEIETKKNPQWIPSDFIPMKDYQSFLDFIKIC